MKSFQSTDAVCAGQPLRTLNTVAEIKVRRPLSQAHCQANRHQQRSQHFDPLLPLRMVMRLTGTDWSAPCLSPCVLVPAARPLHTNTTSPPLRHKTDLHPDSSLVLRARQHHKPSAIRVPAYESDGAFHQNTARCSRDAHSYPSYLNSALSFSGYLGVGKVTDSLNISHLNGPVPDRRKPKIK